MEERNERQGYAFRQRRSEQPASWSCIATGIGLAGIFVNWSAHRWGRDGLDPAPAAEALRGAIEDYSRDSTAMNAAAELTGDEAKRLRALGYLGPESVDGE